MESAKSKKKNIQSGKTNTEMVKYYYYMYLMMYFIKEKVGGGI